MKDVKISSEQHILELLERNKRIHIPIVRNVLTPSILKERK